MGHRLCVFLAKARFVGRIQNTLEAQEAVRDADPVVVTTASNVRGGRGKIDGPPGTKAS